jgi:hypothetical protein
MGDSSNQIDRRKFLKVAGGAAAAGGLLFAGQSLQSAPKAEASTAGLAKPGNHHLAWVWQFDDDGSPEEIRSRLAFYGMGILLKTHDATTWMARWDKSGRGIDGSIAVRVASDFFESGGVPFHAWCVVKGLDPIGEAHMAHEVLKNGARSLVLDLEPSDGGYYWQGTPQSALAFGAELRRLQPDAFISMAPDPRPWQVDALPCREFASFCNEIQPQTYWPMFNNEANFRLLRQRGWNIGPDGMTPELVLDVTQKTFEGYNIPIKPIGSGAASGGDWHRFVDHARHLGMPAVSVWRFRTASPEVWPVLIEKRPTFNEYYGSDWGEPPLVSNVPQNQFAKLPDIAEGEQSVNFKNTFKREATTSVQGVEGGAENKVKLSNIAETATKRTTKSFWADPLGLSGLR